MSPFVGRVTAVHRGLGVVDVQWPYGNERMSPDEIVRVDPKVSVWLPPEFDQSYDSYDIQKARSRWASGPLWRGSGLPPGFYKDLAQAWSRGFGEVAAYDGLWHRYAVVWSCALFTHRIVHVLLREHRYREAVKSCTTRYPSHC